MAEFIDFKDRLKRYYLPNKNEILGMSVAIIAMAFIVSFKEWGYGDTFDFGLGILNFTRALIIVAISMIVFDAGQRIWALAINYRIEFKLWTFGILFGFIVAFLTNGNIWIIAPSGFLLHHLASHRIGWFRYGINNYGQGLIAFGGPLASLTLIILVKLLGFALPAEFVAKMVTFNIVLLITSLLPIPPLVGSKVYWGSRMFYAFAVPSIIMAVILLSLEVNIFLTAFISLAIGVAMWLVYYSLFEQNMWRGPA